MLRTKQLLFSIHVLNNKADILICVYIYLQIINMYKLGIQID